MSLVQSSSSPFETLYENAHYLRASDLAKNGKAFTVRALVPNASVAGAPGHTGVNLRIDVQGGFLWKGISGRAVGPVNDAGVRSLTDLRSTSFPAPGSGGGPGLVVADRGVYFTMADQNGRMLTNTGFHFTSLVPRIPAGSVLTPGYGFWRYFMPQDFEMFLPEGATLTLNIFNEDAGTGAVSLFHELALILSGERYVR